MLSLALLTVFIAAPVAEGWGNGGYSSDPQAPDYGTHDWIADAALAMQTREVSFLTSTYHDEFLLGTEGPDNPAYIGDTANHHVYYYSSGALQDDSCAVRAAQMYQVALDYLLAGNLEDAAYSIGALAHYVSDVGVFGHTMGAGTDWGAETHHSDYEQAMDSLIQSLPHPVGLPLENQEAYDATLELAREVTFGSGSIKPNTWMDGHYDWSDEAFRASAMASLSASVVAVAAVMNHLLTEAAASAPPPQAPAVPGAPLALHAVAMSDGRVRVTWARPLEDGGSPITGYLVFKGNDPLGPEPVAEVGPGVFAWLDERTEEGRTYYYWVAANNSVGTGPMAGPVSITAVRNNSPSAILWALALSALSAAIGATAAAAWRRRNQPPTG